jgi:PAS domain S-box-containing protein
MSIYENLFNHVSEAIVLRELMSNGAKARFVDANPAACRLLGYTLDELRGLALADIQLDQSLVDKPPENMEKMLSPEGLLFARTLVRKDGTRFLADINSRLFYQDGKPLVVSSIRDITEQGRTEEELRKARDELEQRVGERTEELQRAYNKLVEESKEKEQAETALRQAQKMEALGLLAGGVAHDFNNVLSAVIGFAELTRDHLPEDSREQRYVRKILEAGIRGRDIVRQMLALSRQSEGKKPVLLSAVVKDGANFLRAAIPSTIRMDIRIGSESGLILGDPTQILQVLMNLCTNAAHAMREKGGRIEIELSDFALTLSDSNPHGIRPGTYAKMEVRDSGVGMTPEVIEKIFDPFFTTKKEGEGTGLGLAVVLDIVKQHHGYITVQSRPDEGSAFTVYFPQMLEAPTVISVFRGETIPTGYGRILLVDDEAILAEMGGEILTELGYHVETRTSSEEALALIRVNPSLFDAVITDQTMPEMTGIELAKEIIAIRANMPVILCTGFSELVNADSAKAAGVKAFVMKPLTKGELAKAVREVLDK